MANTSHYLVAFIIPTVLASCTTQYPLVKASPDAGTVIHRSESSPAYSSVYRPSSFVQPQSVAKRRSVITENRYVPPIGNSPQTKNINSSRLNGMLFKASEQGQINTIWQLLEQGANVRSANINGETALHSAAAYNQAEAVRILMDSGADVNAKTILGWTPLHSAARFGYSDVVSVLLQSGANPRLRNTAGRTALSLAQQARHQNVVNVLQGR